MCITHKARSTLESWHQTLCTGRKGLGTQLHLSTWNDGVTNPIHRLQMFRKWFSTGFSATTDCIQQVAVVHHITPNIYLQMCAIHLNDFLLHDCHCSCGVVISLCDPQGVCKGWSLRYVLYSELQPGSQLMTDHMTTLLNYQRH